MEEIWKPIPGYESRYIASSLGRIKSLPSVSRSVGVVLKPTLKKSGYLSVTLCKGGKVKYHRVHRLIAKAFLPNPDNLPDVNHKNGVKTDNRVSNIEWLSKSDNAKHAYRVLGHKSKGGTPCRKIRCVDNGTIYESLRALERDTGFKRQSIKYAIDHSGIFAGKHWEYCQPQSG